MERPKFTKWSMNDSGGFYHDEGDWCPSEEVDEFVELVMNLINAVEFYGFPDGTDAGDTINNRLVDLENWVVDTRPDKKSLTSTTSSSSVT